MPHTPPHLIEADGLSMQYTIGTRQVQVLRDVSLSIAAGTSVVITGPSGSGKTSLLLLLSGLERPGVGSIRIDGTDLSSLSSDGLADLRRCCRITQGLRRRSAAGTRAPCAARPPASRPL